MQINDNSFYGGIMTKDKDLLQYCKDKKLPVEEMTIKEYTDGVKKINIVRFRLIKSSLLL